LEITSHLEFHFSSFITRRYEIAGNPIIQRSFRLGGDFLGDAASRD
jgi:hypothetical protein